MARVLNIKDASLTRNIYTHRFTNASITGTLGTLHIIILILHVSLIFVGNASFFQTFDCGNLCGSHFLRFLHVMVLFTRKHGYPWPTKKHSVHEHNTNNASLLNNHIHYLCDPSLMFVVFLIVTSNMDMEFYLHNCNTISLSLQ